VKISTAPNALETVTGPFDGPRTYQVRSVLKQVRNLGEHSMQQHTPYSTTMIETNTQTLNVTQESQTHFTEQHEHTSMKLGVYRQPSIDADEQVYVREGLYDFEAGEWDDTTRGEIVMKASRNPSPQELVVRFDTDPNARSTIVRTPEEMRDEDVEIRVAEQELTVEEGHAKREENNGPLVTQTEMEYRKQQNVTVFPDDFDIPELDRQIAEENGDKIIRESEWDGLDFEAEFDYDVGFEY